MARRGHFAREGRSSRGRNTNTIDSWFQPGSRIDNFEVVSWEDSANDIISRLRERMNNSGSNVYIYTYGWGSNDRNVPDRNVPDRNRGGSVRPEPPKPDPEKVLTVKNVNLKLTTNGSAHHTDRFEISSPNSQNPILVARRGQPISIEIEFSKPYDPKKDDLKLVFEAGDKPLVSKGTSVEFILSDEDKPKEWGAKIVSSKDNKLTIDVFTPPTCFVGKWAFRIDVVKTEDTKINVYRYQHKDPIYIIFNPWCKDDMVYMPNTSWLNEYILNETGKIYSGTKSSINAKPWNFGQFESHVLDVALYLLEIGELSWAVRGNAIPVIRKLSAMVNAPDDGGVLTGNWSGNYAGGKSPLTWTGSAAILEEYWQTRRPVKFGQCWVFSGVATTLCRAIGIPARSVTNFASAHDRDGSITIDIHLKENGERDDYLTEDSVWNFHVWNEVWMARPDLPEGYGGWQAFDATPQETSDGVYCGGPTSVHAIQQGEVNLPYDGPFLFAEVNADTLYWRTNDHGVMECTYIDKNSIGKFISTKAPNSNEREDLTDIYKHAEGSAEERAAVLKANQVGSTRTDIYKKKADDVKFNIEQDPESSWVGANFEIGLRMKNNSSERRTVGGRIAVNTMFYTGVSADKLKSEPFTNIVLKPGEEKVEKVVVTQDEYDGKLKDCCMLDVTIWAHVDETDQNFTKKDSYTLRKPHLTVKAPKEVMVNKEFKIDVSFANPLSSSLTGCSVTVDGVSQAIKFPQGNVSGSGTFTTTLPVIATKVGNEELIVIFNSVQLEDINTSFPVHVRA